jgi:hypothetical protein
LLSDLTLEGFVLFASLAWHQVPRREPPHGLVEHRRGES